MSDDPYWDTIPDPPMHYDRLGVPITLREWTQLFEDRHYQVIEQTMVGHILVSTVWLGLDHSFHLPWLGRYLPLIFETMVFDHRPDNPQPGFDLEMERYGSEGEAREGHARMVQMVETLEGIEHG